MIGLRRRAGAAPGVIETPRLRLLAVTPELVEAEAEGGAALSRAVGAEVGPEWPPQHWDMQVRTHILAQFEEYPESVGWHRYVALCEANELVGCLGAFPCAAGDVEIGYSVLRSHQRRGYAVEAASAFVEWLLEQPNIRSVTAQSYETTPGSVKVMQRCGMRFIGPGDQPGTVRYRRWR